MALSDTRILEARSHGDIVIDPFFGSGTTGYVSEKLGRRWIGCELNEEYKKIQDERFGIVGVLNFA